MCGVPKNHNTTVFVMDIGSQVVISQYKMDLFPLAVRAPRNYFLCQYKGSRRVWNPSYKTDLESKFWFLFAVFFSRLLVVFFPTKSLSSVQKAGDFSVPIQVFFSEIRAGPISSSKLQITS
jgi:hypothetical protein